MDEKELNTLDQLLSLLAEQDEINAEYVAMIAEVLHPTVLSALLELLNVKEEQVDWEDIFVAPEDLVLHVTCVVAYGPNDVIPEFVSRIALPEHFNEAKDVRVVRIGIPVTHCLLSKAEIIKFFHEILLNQPIVPPAQPDMPTPVPPPAPVTSQFDLSNLTKGQIAQLLMFQHNAPGGKH